VEVGYDERAFLIDGRRTLLLSGAIHYWRSTPGMWRDLLRKSREAGLNCIETYVFWGAHERVRGTYDFDGRLDLRGFIEACATEGLHVVLRIGPYICAEVNFGGLPSWMLEVDGLHTRTDNAPFKEEVTRFVARVIEEVGDLQPTHGGPIILAQLENEYGIVQERYGDAGARYLDWISELGPRLAIKVPMIMCEGAAGTALPTLNGFDVADRVGGLRAENPGSPSFWTECWTGWYDVWGGTHHRRDARELASKVVQFLAAGGTAINYYMWHGGTNLGRETMYSGTTSYDFDAPLDEWGGATPKAAHLAALHAALREMSPLLVDYETRTERELRPGVRCTTWALGRDRLVAVSNRTEDTVDARAHGLEITLPAGASALLRAREGGLKTVFESHQLTPPPAEVSWRVVASSFGWRTWSEPLGRVADDPRPVARLNAPASMLPLTHDRTDYCWYEAEIASEAAGETELVFPEVRDVSHLFWNGDYVGSSPGRLDEDLPRHWRHTYRVTGRPGVNRVQLLVVSMGLVKGDWQIGMPMDQERKGLIGAVVLGGRPVATRWSLTPGLLGEAAGLPTGNSLRAAPGGGSPARLRWFQAEFESAAGQPHTVEPGNLRKGILWVNGHCLGRFWQAPAEDLAESDWMAGRLQRDAPGPPTQRRYHLPGDWVRDGVNLITVFDEMGGDPAGLTVRVQAR
jgi:beta-galactosidase